MRVVLEDHSVHVLDQQRYRIQAPGTGVGPECFENIVIFLSGVLGPSRISQQYTMPTEQAMQSWQ
jgi:hypothetical protein